MPVKRKKDIFFQKPNKMQQCNIINNTTLLPMKYFFSFCTIPVCTSLIL